MNFDPFDPFDKLRDRRELKGENQGPSVPNTQRSHFQGL